MTPTSSPLRCYLDVETTGISRSAGARVVEVGACVFDQAEEIASWSSLSNPGAEALGLPDVDEALAVNKLTREEILAAPPELEVAEKLRAWLAQWRDREAARPLKYHAFNNAFDSKFLTIEPWRLDSHAWGDCVMLISAPIVNPQNRRWPRLEVAAAHFKVPFDGVAHRALADARVAARIHQKILIGAKR